MSTICGEIYGRLSAKCRLEIARMRLLGLLLGLLPCLLLGLLPSLLPGLLPSLLPGLDGVRWVHVIRWVRRRDDGSRGASTRGGRGG